MLDALGQIATILGMLLIIICSQPIFILIERTIVSKSGKDRHWHE